MVPRAYVVDELESLIIVEYLSDYKSFVDLLRSGQVSAGQESVAIQVGADEDGRANVGRPFRSFRRRLTAPSAIHSPHIRH